jgi:hypothetical protein
VNTEPTGNEPPAKAAGVTFGCKPIWPAISFLCMIVCLGIVAIAVFQLMHPHGRKSTQTGIYGVIGLFGIGVLVTAYVCFRLCGQKYRVFPDRLVAWQAFRPTTFRWDQIREVFQNVHPAWITYRVVTSGGREFTLRGETKNHKRLGEIIAGRVASRLLPAAMKELEAGRDIRLGPLRVSAAGVTIDGQLEPWHRIGPITFGMDPNPKRGTSLRSAMVHARIGGFWVELGDIPNYRLFEELAGQMFPACVAR